MGQKTLDLFYIIFSVATISEDSEEELPIWMRKASLEQKKEMSEIRGATDEPMVHAFNQFIVVNGTSGLKIDRIMT